MQDISKTVPSYSIEFERKLTMTNYYCSSIV